MLVAVAGRARSQTDATGTRFSRINTFGIFTAYSNDSTHMLMGAARNRKLLNIGVTYGRRLMAGRFASWQYNLELMPVALESDPVVHSILQQQTPTMETFTSNFRQWEACVPNKASYSVTLQDGVVYSGTITIDCNRTWTVGEAFSPVGMQWNFRPRHRLQPVVTGHGGYICSSQAVPVDFAGSFNFTFDIGAGVEWFRSATRSMRLDYRYHHYRTPKLRTTILGSTAEFCNSPTHSGANNAELSDRSLQTTRRYLLGATARCRTPDCAATQ